MTLSQYNKSRRSTVPALGIFVLTLIAVASTSCSYSGGEYTITLAKLHNLKVAMSYITQSALNGDQPFPKDTQEIIDFMETDIGYGRSKRTVKDNPFKDGWGNEMRFQGDIKSYSIRSAGPDGIFDTPDDIYLAGNPDSEHIIDGVKESTSSGKDLMETRIKIPFQESNGYYRITLPGKYSVIRSHAGWRSEVTFRYTEKNTVKIVAEPYTDRWMPQREMETKAGAIRNGRDAAFGNYEIVESDLVQIDNAPGFEISAQKDDSIARIFGVASNEQLRYSISITASGEDRQYIMDTLTEAVKERMDLR